MTAFDIVHTIQKIADIKAYIEREFKNSDSSYHNEFLDSIISANNALGHMFAERLVADAEREANERSTNDSTPE